MSWQPLNRRNQSGNPAYTRRFLGGRQPLCGSGVTSSIDLMVMPAACSAVIALSRPLPGPLTRTSSSRTPNLEAFSAHCWAAIWPAKGVLLRLPLKPLVPALAQHSASPLVSVIVTLVLLNVALMWATPTVTLRRVFLRLLLATNHSSSVVQCSLRRSRATGRVSICLPEILHALLPGHGLLGTFAGAGIGARALSAN